MCSDSPAQIREEIQVLIDDLVLRVKKSIFAGVSTAFLSIMLPCIFVPVSAFSNLYTEKEAELNFATLRHGLLIFFFNKISILPVLFPFLIGNFINFSSYRILRIFHAKLVVKT